jgi:hypothetical protein
MRARLLLIDAKQPRTAVHVLDVLWDVHAYVQRSRFFGNSH